MTGKEWVDLYMKIGQALADIGATEDEMNELGFLLFAIVGKYAEAGVLSDILDGLKKELEEG